MAGREDGRINRFLPEDASPTKLKEKRERDRERLSALMALLQSDPAYAALYNETLDKLREAEAAADVALVEATEALIQAQDDLANVLDQANALPEGTKVFRDADGNVWDEHGNRINGAALDGIQWRENTPSYEDYLASKRAVDEAQRVIDAIRRYQVDVLGHARDRLTDQDNPPTKDELKDIQRNIEQQMPDAVRHAMPPVPGPKAPSDGATAIKPLNLGS